jgi:2TM domain
MTMQTEPVQTRLDDDALRSRALVSLRKKHEFVAHVLAYVLVNSFLVAIWAVTGDGFFWPIFPMVGWAIGLVFHGWDTYSRPPSETRIREEMDRLRETDPTFDRPDGRVE